MTRECAKSPWHAAFGLSLLAWLLAQGAAAQGCSPPGVVREAGPEEIRDFFKARKMRVLTFLGYSALEYEDKPAMLKEAERILNRYERDKTLVNLGATPEGIGAVYELAKQKGFLTTGIVSSQALANKAALSPCVDVVFYVKDDTWGGFLPGTGRLSPTSTAMVENSDVIVAIGGGEVARDELTVAKQLGKRVRFIPADMNHQIALEKARQKGQPEPTDFRGAAASVF
jgi:hypothetical protein